MCGTRRRSDTDLPQHVPFRLASHLLPPQPAWSAVLARASNHFASPECQNHSRTACPRMACSHEWQALVRLVRREMRTRSSTSQQVRACTHVSSAPRAGPRRAFSPTPAHAAATQLRQRKRSAPSRPNRSRPIRSRPNCTSQQVRARYRACACLRRAAASRTPAPASSPPSPACAPQEPASAAPASAAPRLRPPPTCAHSSRTRPRSLRSVPSSRLTSLS